jgi:hypothetical protein
MKTQGFNNPFQLPQIGQKPVQQQPNPFGGAPGRNASARFGGNQTPTDNFGKFKDDITSGAIKPNPSSPRPGRGMGGKILFTA